MLSSDKIKPVTSAIIEVYLSEGISKSISQKIEIPLNEKVKIL